MPRGLGRKIGTVYIKAPFRRSMEPGGDQEAFEAIAYKLLPPLVVPRMAWVTLRGVQDGNDEIDAAGRSEFRFGATQVAQSFDYKPGSTPTDITETDIVQMFSIDYPEFGGGAAETDELHQFETGTDAPVREVGDAGLFWRRWHFSHDFRSGVVTASNKLRHFFHKTARLRRMPVLEAMNPELPNIVALTGAVGVNISANTSDVGDILVGDAHPSDLYREILLQLGAYRNPAASNDSSFPHQGTLPDEIVRWLASGPYSTSAGTPNLSEDFIIFGRMSLACDVYEGQSARILTVN